MDESEVRYIDDCVYFELISDFCIDIIALFLLMCAESNNIDLIIKFSYTTCNLNISIIISRPNKVSVLPIRLIDAYLSALGCPDERWFINRLRDRILKLRSEDRLKCMKAISEKTMHSYQQAAIETALRILAAEEHLSLNGPEFKVLHKMAEIFELPEAVFDDFVNKYFSD
ncbi:MAG: hypothetical protein CUN49_06125 [Candidatus Thermofonsia Clade 1 bacterium]|uniref:Uncharacterized protein n=1 Tax=Candidatus Thermofonsia Clade 1 bacterium TaxID=2364210 RepID=A0A2M8PFL7_9CHLR|nr:MAG: hypothetical protein CUN49_06125 [Candidatus Thermofonsia Clade 1 bacterium]